MLAGIDYGAKRAGTTVVALLENGTINLQASQPKQDADAFVQACFADKKPAIIFLDAPLSLPLVYRFPEQHQDYHYRQCDRELGAMSPLFLGGLTARAMSLAYELRKQQHTVLETYPAQQAKRLGLHEHGYKQRTQNPTNLLPMLEEAIGAAIPSCPSWHAFDALLALLGGCRYEQGIHETVGDPEEGVITW